METLWKIHVHQFNSSQLRSDQVRSSNGTPIDIEHNLGNKRMIKNVQVVSNSFPALLAFRSALEAKKHQDGAEKAHERAKTWETSASISMTKCFQARFALWCAASGRRKLRLKSCKQALLERMCRYLSRKRPLHHGGLLDLEDILP